MNNLLTYSALGLLITSSSNAFAQECSIHFNYGVIIHPKHIRMVDHGQTQVQINNSKQVFIKGREIDLSVQQQQLVIQFSDGLREQLPSIVSIAIEGVDIGLKAVNDVIGSLTGENSASQQKVQAKFDELKWRARARFNQSANNYYIAPQDFTDLDGIFAGQFEQEIEEIITTSIGTILTAVGESMLSDSSHGEYGSEERITTFDERLNNLSDGLDLEISERAKTLNKKATTFCLQLNDLNKIENQLQQEIPALKKYNLIKTTN
jgi:hypothetical protein